MSFPWLSHHRMANSAFEFRVKQDYNLNPLTASCFLFCFVLYSKTIFHLSLIIGTFMYTSWRWNFLCISHSVVLSMPTLDLRIYSRCFSVTILRLAVYNKNNYSLYYLSILFFVLVYSFPIKLYVFNIYRKIIINSYLYVSLFKPLLWSTYAKWGMSTYFNLPTSSL